MSNPSARVQKLRHYCGILRDDALSHGVAEVERRLRVEEELEAVAYANLARSQRLRQSALQKAFLKKLA